ncbi:HNH endonuclease [Deinococcus irradiatisoli]|uniref:HNH endonuclease n=1 Tax=Deinococcus irradiatisoli TaxID=2202254 RepID=A0A2Z3JIK5_9DEIO|nr:HNH endonuclease [Deinococcus irradiatisoli]AWN23210.1 HNH endonuclease [Deinococcus irradiatisoli]
MRRHNALPLLVLFAVLIVLAAYLLLRQPGTGRVESPRPAESLPNPTLTPGDVLTSDRAVICRSGYTQTVRNVPSSLKTQVYRSYGVTSRQPGEYEIDHLISLELGGSNSVRNLWPESYVTKPLNAHVKDSLENKLHALACNGTISMKEAQQAIAQDWTAAYVKYVGPLPTR